MRSEGRYAEAVPVAARGLEICTRAVGPSSWDTVEWERRLSTIRRLAALPSAEQLEIARVDAELGTIYALCSEQKFREAAEFAEHQISAFSERLGSAHPETLSWMGDVGELRRRAGLLQDAEAILAEGVARSRTELGPADPLTAALMQNLAAARSPISTADQRPSP